MGYHSRIETSDKATFITTRTKNSELWFANNLPVEQFALGLLAKLCDFYGAKLYAFCLEGSHYHAPMKFPHMNRASFARDFNSGLANAVARLTPNYNGGGLWARRYSGEHIAGDEDIERQFFYTVLQPVKDGLVDRISDYPFYNCFKDAVSGIERKFELIDWAKYNAALRYNKNLRMRDFVKTYTLKYERLPGYEDLSQHEYRVLMEKKLEFHRQEIIAKRLKEGKTACLGRGTLLLTVPGMRAVNPKTSTRHSHRPRILSWCNQRRAIAQAWYFDIYFRYKESSRRFRAGEIEVAFPQGTYRPPSWIVVRPSGPYSPL